MHVNILLSAYSFGAWRGSEAGVGWNVAKGLAERGHKVTVLATPEFHDLNVPALEKIALPITLVEEGCGIREYNCSSSYRFWQRSIGPAIRRICRGDSFDLIHHITFNQYRGIRDVFFADLPYVIGPVGGAETVDLRFFSELPFTMRIKEALRYIPIDSVRLGMRVRRNRHGGVVLASTPQTEYRLKKHAGISSVALLPIIAIHEDEIRVSSHRNEGAPYFVFDGGTRPEKGARVMIRALASIWADGRRVPVKVFAVRDEDKELILRYAESCGLPREALHLYPYMKRSEVLNLMLGATAFISVGFRDAGCMALLEAVALGLPAICLSISGQHWLPDDYATKIPLHSGSPINHIIEALKKILLSPTPPVSWHENRVRWLRENMTWDARISQLEKFYSLVLLQNRDYL